MSSPTLPRSKPGEPAPVSVPPGRPSPSPLTESVRASAAVLAVTLLALLAAWLREITRPLNHDVGWLLYVASCLERGTRSHAELLETNPPLILWLFALPAWLADRFQGSQILALRNAVMLGIGSVLFLADRLLRRLSPPPATLLRHLWLAVASLLLALGIGSDFAQREHLIAALLVPHLVAVAVWLSDPAGGEALPRALRWTTSLAAAVAVALKPFFLPAVLLPELALAIRRRAPKSMLRLEMRIFVGFGLVYVLAAVLFVPSYFDVVLPLVRDGWWAFQEPLSQILQVRHLLILAAAVCAAFFTPSRYRGLGSLAWVLSLSAVGSYLAYLAGGVSWEYHLVPFRACAWGSLAASSLAFVGLGARRASLPPAGAKRVWPRAVLLALLVAPVVLGFRVPDALAVLRTPGDLLTPAVTRDPDLLRLQGYLLEHTSDRRTISVLSPLIGPFFPIVNHAHLQWGSRFQDSWILLGPTYARAGYGREKLSEDRLREIETYFQQAVTEDLTRYRPQLVLIETGDELPRFGRLGMSYLHFLWQYPPFHEVWNEYRWTGRIVVHSRAFEVYRLR